MQQELLIQTVKMVENTPEKWNSFLELVWKKDTIRNNWYGILKQKLDKQFMSMDRVENWSYKSWGLFDAQWYLTDFGDQSLSLIFGWWGELTLHANGQYFNLDIIGKLLKTSKYSPIMACFNRIDSQSGNRIAIESRNFNFGSPYDGKFDLDRLAWYAGNMTEEFVKQIAEKVNKFRNNKEVTGLMIEINEQAKICVQNDGAT
jgi:hypothetical protein